MPERCLGLLYLAFARWTKRRGRRGKETRAEKERMSQTAEEEKSIEKKTIGEQELLLTGTIANEKEAPAAAGDTTRPTCEKGRANRLR